MSFVVWKYPLPDRLNVLRMPADPGFLSVGWQKDGPVIWATVNHLLNTQCEYEVYVIMTGEVSTACQKRAFVGTVQSPDSIVHHVFAWPTGKCWLVPTPDAGEGR